MNKKIARCLAWYVVGQITQLVLALVAKVSYMDKPILFSLAAGFLVTVAICAGVKLARGEKPEKLSYLDYAEGRHE